MQDGFVRWNRRRKADGAHSFWEQLFDESHRPDLRLLVSREEKDVKSRDGIRSTVKTSPYCPVWVRDAEAAVKRIVPFIRRRDLEA